MAVKAGMRTSYSDTTAQKRAIADMIDMISPTDVPLLKFLGIGEKGQGGRSKVKTFRIMNWPSTKVEWLEDELAPLSTTTGGTMSSDTTAMTIGDAYYLRQGHVILIDSEYILVTSVSSDSQTITRNWGGTQATHASGATVTVVGNAHVQGEDSAASTTMDVTAPYNYTQILEDQVKISRTQQKILQYGVNDEYDYQVDKKFKEQLRLLEKALFYGQRQVGSATASAGMGGLPTFVTDNTTAMADAALTRKAFDDAVQAAWEDGGTPDLVVCNAWVKRKITSFYEPNVRTTRLEKRGGVTISEVETEFGVLQVLMDRWCPSTSLYILQSEYVGVLPFDPFFEEPLAKDGDYTLGHVVGEYTLVVRNDKAHALISGISTTA